MNTIGLFAGRGDVVLAMGVTFLFGLLLGWKVRGFISWLRKQQ